MKVICEYLKNEFVFDSTKSNSNKVKININCEIIDIDYNSIINTQFSGGNIKDEFEDLKSFLNLGIYSKSPCGGFINFYSITGSCGGKYILFSGVKEASNSHYIVTIHKILGNG